MLPWRSSPRGRRPFPGVAHIAILAISENLYTRVRGHEAPPPRNDLVDRVDRCFVE